MSSLVILAALVFEILCGKNSDRQPNINAVENPKILLNSCC